MIAITLEGKRMHLRNCYEYRDAIKALAGPPDVKWLADRKVWSVDVRLYDKLAFALGAHFAPLPYDFFCRLPRPEIRTGYYAALKRNAEAAENERTNHYKRKAGAWR